jgi:hypothetical protein
VSTIQVRNLDKVFKTPQVRHLEKVFTISWSDEVGRLERGVRSPLAVFLYNTRVEFYGITFISIIATMWDVPNFITAMVPSIIRGWVPMVGHLILANILI